MVWRGLAIVALSVGAFASAIGVVVARHEARQAFVEQQAVLAERDRLNLEWTRLQIEQSTWATPGRIERHAREELGMSRPDADRLVVIGRDAWVR
ncbi:MULTISPECIES: cell division protein FtsL [Thioalkalivibrio]|uniref:Cell division protein FtsL n=1 Tax=Thioalkalivibrio halophilus TaxID=252474 RepID=A0A1V2ZWH8_9GAMM|nr:MULTISPECIES: cell division protein FtsL [Thioalkalivibrio]OOC09183.1 cell division protein FtsL [Thioalkalivibrio halophilus]PYG03107.1 cell division protein FtsL [Thioalkalivibrio sp. ALE21]